MKRWRMGVALAACAAAGVSGSPVAHAAESDDVKALVRQGTEQLAHKQFDAARESFARAYGLDPEAKTLLYLALAELESNRPVEAAVHFRAYVSRSDAAADKRGAVEARWLPLAESQLARVQLVAPAGAQVLVDGKPVAPDPSLGVFEVAAGDHDIGVVSAGRSATQHLTAVAGTTVTMRVLVNDPVAEPSPAATAMPPATVEPESPEEPPPSSLGPSGSKIATVASLGGAALVGVGLGVGFGLAATAKNSAVEGGEGCVASQPTSIPCQHVNYDVSVEHRDEWISIGSYVGAGVLGAAGLASWFFWPRSPARVTALVDGRRVGLGVEGRW